MSRDGSDSAPAHDLDHLVALGSAAHPDIPEPAALRAFLADRATPGAARVAGDLYLAAACAAGDPAATAAIEAMLPALIRPALARLGLAPADDDEILQQVRIAQLVPDPTGRRGIAGYRGRGALRSYLRAVAVRLALKYLERARPHAHGDDALALLPEHGTSPELRAIAARNRAELRAAFEAAIAALAARDRVLLRQHHLDGMTIDELAQYHGVHRASCARWVARARAAVLRGMRRDLRTRLGLDEAGLDELTEAIDSQLDLSLSRLLPRLD